MLKPGYSVSLSTGVHLSLKKLTEYRKYIAKCLYWGYVYVQPSSRSTPCSLSGKIMNVEMETNVETKILS